AVCHAHRVTKDGLVLTSGPRTAMDLARWTRSDPHRLAMVDLAARFGLVTPEEFAEFIAPLGGFHGLNAVRPLVGVATALAESVPESHLRWHWLQAGLAPP